MIDSYMTFKTPAVVILINGRILSKNGIKYTKPTTEVSLKTALT